ncbi:MAG: phosphoglycerate dehydrogenase [Propionibacteriaceae bacterium]|jgi:D-3-phosphoglycerate dehydrogenase|nr:phosphoglycerate dehydrogenase [Propionibacteriaceae bacterium]
MKALLLENIHESAKNLLTDRGYSVETRHEALSEAELLEVLPGFDLVGIRSQTHITSKVIETCPDLKAVGAFCIGTNQIQVNAASEAGVAVFNAPFSNTRSVVELAICEIIALARHVTDQNAKMQSGVWDKSAKGSHEIRGRTLGIVGYGNIGSQLSVLAEALGMRVVFYDIVDKLALGNARKCDTLHELLRLADVVTLHVDGREKNRHFFGPKQFAAMKPRALFINLCRGFVVDHEALRDGLVSGAIAGAAVDVFPTEPAASGDPFHDVIQGLPNVILTPHVGGSTMEAQEDIGRFVAGKLADYVERGTTVLSINLPQVQAEPAGVLRILHIHRNVPGVLAKLNTIFSDHEVNVEAQQLATLGSLGYVITDINSVEHPGLGEELRALPETVRVSSIRWDA